MAVRTAIAIVILSVAGLLSRDMRSHREYRSNVPPLDNVEAQPAGWTSRDQVLTPVSVKVLGADAYLNRVYDRPDGKWVSVFVAYFAEQGVNSQIHSPRQCVPGGGWNVISHGKEILPVGEGEHPAANILISDPARKTPHRMLYWFRTRSGLVTGEYALKWDLVVNSLARRPTDAVFIRFFAEEENYGAMLELIDMLDPSLDLALHEVGL